jgi:pyruvate, orthophosphate dikinase
VEGELIGVDGTDGTVVDHGAKLIEPTLDERFDQVLAWADELRRLGVRVNADTPQDATRARELGAQGIGLCRTEHMFMAEDRQPKMRAMIMARDEDGRRAALSKLLPLQEEDFIGIFEAMQGLPVTIRLLDEMQVHAIMRAAKAVDERPHPEIMIPLVAYEHEIEIMRELVWCG